MSELSGYTEDQLKRELERRSEPKGEPRDVIIYLHISAKGRELAGMYDLSDAEGEAVYRLLYEVPVTVRFEGGSVLAIWPTDEYRYEVGEELD